MPLFAPIVHDHNRLVIHARNTGKIEQLALPRDVRVIFSGDDNLMSEGHGDLANRHDHFSFAATVELAKKDALPAPQQKFSFGEWNRNARTNEARFDVGVRILFAVMKAHPRSEERRVGKECRSRWS